MFGFVVGFGLMHALLFLPVILSIIGPEGSEKDDEYPGHSGAYVDRSWGHVNQSYQMDGWPGGHPPPHNYGYYPQYPYQAYHHHQGPPPPMGGGYPPHWMGPPPHSGYPHPGQFKSRQKGYPQGPPPHWQYHGY